MKKGINKETKNKEVKELQKTAKKKNLSSALRKNLLRRKTTTNN